MLAVGCVVCGRHRRPQTPTRACPGRQWPIVDTVHWAVAEFTTPPASGPARSRVRIAGLGAQCTTHAPLPHCPARPGNQDARSAKAAWPGGSAGRANPESPMSRSVVRMAYIGPLRRRPRARALGRATQRGGIIPHGPACRVVCDLATIIFFLEISFITHSTGRRPALA